MFAANKGGCRRNRLPTRSLTRMSKVFLALVAIGLVVLVAALIALTRFS
jgi:hypothetical protein